MIAPNSFVVAIWFFKHECTGGGQMTPCALHGYAPDNIAIHPDIHV